MVEGQNDPSCRAATICLDQNNAGQGGSKRIPGRIEGETTDSNAAAGSVNILPAFTLQNHRQQNV
jgi:hypothetical protein